MKKVEAIIKPFKLDDVKEALTELGVARRGDERAEVRERGRRFGEAGRPERRGRRRVEPNAHTAASPVSPVRIRRD